MYVTSGLTEDNAGAVLLIMLVRVESPQSIDLDLYIVSSFGDGLHLL